MPDAGVWVIVANCAALFSHVCPYKVGSAHWGAHDAEVVNLCYVNIGRKHGREGLKGA
jgi:hypothetical protein